MRENEESLASKEKIKEKIRNRYKGIDTDNIEVIEADPVDNIHEDSGKERRVAAYCRVSTDDPNQTSSYELQRNYYNDYISKKSGWILVDIYADEGISGTSLKHREAFNKMIADCKSGKIDLIVTKSVSRFARNILDCVGIVRELKSLPNPVGVLFETEGIYTLDPRSEMQLSFMATIAQEESHIKSDVMNASIEMRFKRGIFLTPVLLGYDLDDEGNLVVNEEEAKTVRLIFFMYLYGYTCSEIALQLETLHRKTKRGNTDWSPSSVLQILQNERHCGDLLAHKTWTPNFLDHKSVKNNGKKKKYRVQDHHEAIISRDDFIAVQRLIANGRCGSIGFLPGLSVIKSGSLTGFVLLHTKWSAFKKEDYLKASKSAYGEEEIATNNQERTVIEVEKGDFDLRGFQIARSQFFNNRNNVCITFSIDSIVFGKESLRKLNGTEYIEMLLHPEKKLIAVRPAKKDSKYRLKWCKKSDGSFNPVGITGKPFLKVLFDIFEWNSSYRYRINGIRKQNESETILLFDMAETEIFIPTNLIENGEVINNDCSEDVSITQQMLRTKRLCAYPTNWIETFGSEYYAQAREMEMFSKTGKWDSDIEGEAIENGEQIKIMDRIELKTNINNLISTMDNVGE